MNIKEKKLARQVKILCYLYLRSTGSKRSSFELYITPCKYSIAGNAATELFGVSRNTFMKDIEQILGYYPSETARNKAKKAGDHYNKKPFVLFIKRRLHQPHIEPIQQFMDMGSIEEILIYMGLYKQGNVRNDFIIEDVIRDVYDNYNPPHIRPEGNEKIDVRTEKVEEKKLTFENRKDLKLKNYLYKDQNKVIKKRTENVVRVNFNQQVRVEKSPLKEFEDDFNRITGRNDVVANKHRNDAERIIKDIFGGNREKGKEYCKIIETINRSRAKRNLRALDIIGSLHPNWITPILEGKWNPLVEKMKNEESNIKPPERSEQDIQRLVESHPDHNNLRFEHQSKLFTLGKGMGYYQYEAWAIKYCRFVEKGKSLKMVTTSTFAENYIRNKFGYILEDLGIELLWVERYYNNLQAAA